MANEILTAQLLEIIPEIQAQTMVKFNNSAGILDAITVKNTSGVKGKNHKFAKWSTMASSDVQTPSEGEATTTKKQLSVSNVDATVAKRQVLFFLSDEDLFSVDPALLESADLIEQISAIGADAMRAKVEDEIVSLFSTFTGSVAGAGVTLAPDHFNDAINVLKGYRMRGDRFGALHPKQMRGGKGIADFLTGVSISNNFASTSLPQEMLDKGYVGKYNTFSLLESTEIDDDVSSGGDAAGALFSKMAIGLHHKGISNMELDRVAGAGYNVYLTGWWKAVLIEPDWGVYFLTDVS